jgi:protein involved in polysaccharide export with SLBB domain
MRSTLFLSGLAISVLLLPGCKTLQGKAPNLPGPEPTVVEGRPASTPLQSFAPAQVDTVTATTSASTRWSASPPLSPGDRLQIEIEDGEGFSGRYEIGIDGTLRLPQLDPLSVAGADTDEVEQRLARALVAARLFKAHRVRVSVLVHEWSHVQVHVDGAVFAPGMVSVNVRSPEERQLKETLAGGDFPSERMLSAGLRAAGGIRPDAALDQVQLVRGDDQWTINYTGMIGGRGAPSVPLMAGDRIVVPSTGRFDPQLAVTSPITPPGIRVFLSNLTVPATGNAISAVGKDARRLPYGSRLLTAALSANCVGGIDATSASRHAVLVRTDPLNGREQTLERPIHDLLAAPDNDEGNPHLMPNDGVACYDSGVTNLRDIARTIAELLLPISLL